MHCEKQHTTEQQWTYLWRVVALRRPPGRLIIRFVHQDVPEKHTGKGGVYLALSSITAATLHNIVVAS